jgi:type IV secretion system protein TrbL
MRPSMIRKLLALAFIALRAIAQAPALPQNLPITAPVIDNTDLLTSAFQGLITPWSAAVQPYAYEIFGALCLLELSTFGWVLWQNHRHDGGSVTIAVAGKILALGMFLTLLQNGGQWMGDIINAFEATAKGASGMPALYPSTIIGQGSTIAGIMLSEADKMGSFLHPVAGMSLVVCAFFIFVAFLVIAVHFVIFKIASFVVLASGLIMLAFGGSRWTVSFVERYFALCFSIGMRLFFIYFTVSAGWMLTNTWITTAQKAAHSSNAIQLAFVLMGDAAMFCVVCWFIPSICGSILTGTVSFGHGEVIGAAATAVSGAVAMGMVAAGLVAAKASGAGAGSAGKSVAASAGSASSSGGATPSVSPGGGSTGSSKGSAGGGKGSMVGAAARAAGSMAQIGANTASRMPSGGGHASPPHVGGFSH